MLNILKLFKNNKGAMFGLDARISMVIFAILSLSIGAFTFSRIQTAKDAALLRELEEIHSAIAQMQEDLGTFYPFAMATGENRNDFAALWNLNKIAHRFQPLWNGPYFTKETIKHGTYGEFSLKYTPDDMKQKCSYKSKCFVWITLTEVPENIWIRINAYVDESFGETKETDGRAHILGKIRSEDASEERTLFFKSVSRLRK